MQSFMSFLLLSPSFPWATAGWFFPSLIQPLSTSVTTGLPWLEGKCKSVPMMGSIGRGEVFALV